MQPHFGNEATVQGARQGVKKPLLGYLTAVGHGRIFFSVSGTVEPR